MKLRIKQLFNRYLNIQMSRTINHMLRRTQMGRSNIGTRRVTLKSSERFSLPGLLMLSAVLVFDATLPSQAAERLEDGEYAVEVTMTGGSGKASIESPTLLTVEDGQYYARITWSSSNYDYMLVDGEKYLSQSEEDANSVFVIPVSDLDVDITVTADTLAMGTPHEIEYVMYFYSESLGSKSSLPQEAAKRVLAMAAAIIIGGGILNCFVKKRAKRDYTGPRR